MRETRFQLLLLVLGTIFYPVTEKWFAPWGVSVNYPFLLLFWVTIRRGRTPGTFYGFFIGLLRDLSSSTELGASALAFSLTGYLIGGVREKIDRENVAIRLTLLAGSYLVCQAIYLMPRMDWSLPAAGAAWVRYALPGSVLNALVYLLTLLLVRGLSEGLALIHEPAEH
ncbi:MAG: rod shape-determining protein MreD [bacterium]|nr:rod shape-determining protein MreD [bacterium]